ncbi:MAG: threonine synthase [Armatimonadetes bacterium]|nr:threonine synthase [Armatimonadota bacterium]
MATIPSRSSLRAWFQCSEPGCEDQHYPLNEVVFRCRRCGGLLEVQHDTTALAAASADDWKAALDGRLGHRAPGGSGVWAHHEWIAPGVAPENIVSFAEGGTALQAMGRFAVEVGVPRVWLKQCGVTHTGSFKDLGLTVLVSQVKQMLAEGVPIRAVACASTGDTSAALAAYAAAAGIPAVVFLPRGKISVPQLIQPIANGAKVLALDTDFDGCMEIVQEVTADGGLYLANSLNSLRIEGQKTVAFEIVRQLDWQVPDWIVIPGGNLGNVSALGRGLDLMLQLGLIDRLPRIAVAQSAMANPLYLSYLRDFTVFEPVEAQATAASAIRIGNPVSIKRAVRTLQATNGVVEQASEDELANAAAWADRSGFFIDPHTGVALAAMIKLVGKGLIGRDDRVVVVSTASGLKFPDWKVAYHLSQLEGVISRHANPPIELPATVAAAREALERVLC